MRTRWLAIPAALGAAFHLAGAAQAQPACGPRAQVLAWLAASYREAPVAAGVSGQGALVEVLASPDGATWTILVTAPTGRTCVVGAGEGWRVLERAGEDPKA